MSTPSFKPSVLKPLKRATIVCLAIMACIAGLAEFSGDRKIMGIVHELNLGNGQTRKSVFLLRLRVWSSVPKQRKYGRGRDPGKWVQYAAQWSPMHPVYGGRLGETDNLLSQLQLVLNVSDRPYVQKEQIWQEAMAFVPARDNKALQASVLRVDSGKFGDVPVSED